MRRRDAFTLTELLVSLLITVIVAAVLYLLYNTLYSVTGDQAEIKDTEDAVARALDTLSHDLMSSLLLDDESLCEVSLETVDPYAELEFCTAVPDPESDDFSWHDVQRVSYKVVPYAAGMPTLVRTAQRLSGPGGHGGSMEPVTNALVKNVRSFRVESFDGEEWHTRWKNPDQKGLPRATRMSITLLTSRDQEQRTEVYIPFGYQVESSLSRGSTGVPAPAP